MVEEVPLKENDVLVNFLHSDGPSVYIHCPPVEDKGWLLVERILQLLFIPYVNTSWCHYTFIEREWKDT